MWHNTSFRQIKRDLKIIHVKAKRAAKVMTALLAYSRRVKLQVRRLNLHSVIKKVLAIRQYEERVRNIAVSTKLYCGTAPGWSSKKRKIIRQEKEK